MKKKLILIFCSIFAFLAVGVGAFFVAKVVVEGSGPETTIAEFLAGGHVWKKEGEETVIWTFERDGSCTVTTNGTEEFSCKWYVEGETLGISTEWLTVLEDEFAVKINENDQKFTVTSLKDGKISTFVL